MKCKAKTQTAEMESVVATASKCLVVTLNSNQSNYRKHITHNGNRNSGNLSNHSTKLFSFMQRTYTEDCQGVWDAYGNKTAMRTAPF
jgi:hypothetical protein